MAADPESDGVADGAGAPKSVERPLHFVGNPTGKLAFFTAFPNVLCRVRGSVLPSLWFQVTLSVVLSATAYVLNEHIWETQETMQITGHQIVGTMLAFLVVFRSQIAWGMYTEGRGQLGLVIACTRDLALEICCSLSASVTSIYDQIAHYESLHEDASVRESISLPGGASSRRDGGTPRGEHEQQAVVAPEPPPPVALASSSGQHPNRLRREATHSSASESRALNAVAERYAQLQPHLVLVKRELLRLLKLFFFVLAADLRADEAEAEAEVHATVARLATPGELHELDRCYRRTGRSKGLVVLSWIRMTLDRAHSADWLHEHQMLSLTHTVSDMIKAIGGVQKVNSMVLPLPYAQLLKWGLIIFVFSLPFFIITEFGVFTVPICMLTAVAFFGLDEVGSELEQPFGTDPSDFPLLKMGRALALDLDAMLYTTASHTIKRRLSSPTSGAPPRGSQQDADTECIPGEGESALYVDEADAEYSRASYSATSAASSSRGASSARPSRKSGRSAPGLAMVRHASAPLLHVTHGAEMGARPRPVLEDERWPALKTADEAEEGPSGDAAPAALSMHLSCHSPPTRRIHAARWGGTPAKGSDEGGAHTPQEFASQL